ncbi:hypothetical protein R3P38DRAFT_2986284 [Favolaschia claudopus]|uniref:Uncharacterized protein n=1 Tax=Favolaschia claudopus TaxID=2862362 RepID=A0AAW0AVP8_9AGAR
MPFGSWRPWTRPTSPQTHANWNSFPQTGPIVKINGGTGGNGGAAILQGGKGGKGEGPQFHLPAVTTWHNVEGNAYYSYYYYSCACSCMDSTPDATAEVVAEGRIVRPVRRVAEYIHGDEERTVALIYCALYSLCTPKLLAQSHSRDSHNENAYYDFRRMVQMFSRLLDYIRGDRDKVHMFMHCVSSALHFSGSLSLVDRLRLVPLIALPILAIPTIPSLNDMITLVDGTGKRRPMSLDVWRNPKAFLKALQGFFNGNEELTITIISHRYRIQDRHCPVYRLGSLLVSAGAEIFMAAILYRESTKGMSCPYCKAEVPALPGCNFQTSMDCNHCHQRFSSSSSLQAEAQGSRSLPKESPQTAIDAKPHQPLTPNSNSRVSNTLSTTLAGLSDTLRTTPVQTTSRPNTILMKLVLVAVPSGNSVK